MARLADRLRSTVPAFLSLAQAAYASNLEDALEALKQFPYELMLLDRRLPDGDGAAVHRAGFDFQQSVVSLAQYLRPGFAAFPRHGGYLRPDPAVRTRLHEKYRARANGRRIVGLSWRSVNPAPALRRRRRAAARRRSRIDAVPEPLRPAVARFAEHMVSGIPGARVHADLAPFAQDLIARHAPARASSH
mgnify:CR=1 FL=1